MTTYPMKCQIRAEAGVTRVDVFDDIGGGDWLFGGGISAGDFAGQLAAVSGPLDVHINSYGGDVDAGIAIGNTIRAYQGRKRTVVDGFACSIASVILQAGDERVMQPGSMVMVHDALSACTGNAADMAAAAAMLDKHSDNIAGIYAARAGGSPQQWRATMRSADTWYTADEAVAAGLADRVGDGAAQLPAGVDVDALAAAVPVRIAAAMRTLPLAAAARHEPMTGTHSHPHPAYGAQGGDSMHSHQHSHDGDANHGHDHAEPGGTEDHGDGPHDHEHGPALTLDGIRAAVREELRAASGGHGHPGEPCWDPDGDGDCDLTPEGDTDHDYWAPDGTQLQPVPGRPMPAEDHLTPEIRAAIHEELVTAGLIPGADGFYRPLNAGADNSPWDASKAWHNGAESDDPAAFYAGICAGKKAGDKATQDAWALPYKYTPSSPPNAAGVKNALSRLPQTEGLTNEAEAKATLQAAMKKVNPDYEPEDSTEQDISGIDLEEIRAGLKGAIA